MPFRFVDIDNPPSDYPDFTVRKPKPTLVEMFLFFLMLTLTGTAIVLMVHDALALIAILFTIIGLASVYAGRQVHQNRESQRATEFQNALFASILAKGCRFCLIAGKDGKIIYASPGFHDLFLVPEPEVRYGLAEWIEAAKVPPEERHKLLDTVANEVHAEILLGMAGHDDQHHPMRLGVEPIGRPKGFTLIRAWDSPQGPAK